MAHMPTLTLAEEMFDAYASGQVFLAGMLITRTTAAVWTDTLVNLSSIVADEPTGGTYARQTLTGLFTTQVAGSHWTSVGWNDQSFGVVSTTDVPLIEAFWICKDAASDATRRVLTLWDLALYDSLHGGTTTWRDPNGVDAVILEFGGDGAFRLKLTQVS